MLAHKNIGDPGLQHNRRAFPQDAQKGRPARPQSMKTPEA
jgi:hypothetical protein